MARVLVIEDNPANMELMTYLLRAFGHSVLEATDGRQGVRAALEARPDLIICDLQLPRVDGYEVARTLKADASMRAVPLLAVTAYAMVDDRGKALAAGFDGYFAKPIDPATFIQQIQAFLPAADAAATSKPKRLVLVTDDRAINLELAQVLLAGAGYEVETALSAAQALRLARERPPDLILSDVVMEGGDGYGFIQEIKADPALAGIPFVFLTSTAVSEREKRKGLALGATKYLFRPMEPELLLRELEECLKGEA
jgi:two-component system cell cycle response regulator